MEISWTPRRVLRKHDQRDERCPQEQQAGAGADGAVAVVALAASYISLDGRFDGRIDVFWADLIGGTAFGQ